MQLIDNAWEVTVKSAASWVGWFLGSLGIFYAYVNTSSAHIQEVLHFSAWSEWVPWVIGLATVFGIQTARAINQPAVQAAANK